jgi:hypothetical protein
LLPAALRLPLAHAEALRVTVSERDCDGEAEGLALAQPLRVAAGEALPLPLAHCVCDTEGVREGSSGEALSQRLALLQAVAEPVLLLQAVARGVREAVPMRELEGTAEAVKVTEGEADCVAGAVAVAVAEAEAEGSAVSVAVREAVGGAEAEGVLDVKEDCEGLAVAVLVREVLGVAEGEAVRVEEAVRCVLAEGEGKEVA